ncbi:DUF5340 domain-containing protein [Synechococcus sp. PCC 6312]|uniref:DUF5340 domain-containing protein n=1 Tax=Synechococcus sp. (strain ATCC 27167 / PCC 6312) TaxID=195253 RepID=UPI000317F625|nr:DUF5340 domain-containing protein [Synechococcus sp. PCC 6312]
MHPPSSTTPTIPLPSHIHYELLLKLLEQQSLPSLPPGSPSYTQVQQIIIQLRKAFAVQKNLEHECEQIGWGVEYRWSLTQPTGRAS